MRVVQKRVVPEDRESGIRLRGESVDDVDLRRIAEAAQAASLGFDVCAKRAGTKELGARMTSLADEARSIAEAAAAKVPGGVRRPTTSERMRWEWLASTATLLDGGAEGRVAQESNRHLALAEASAARLDDDELLQRIEELAASSRAAAA
jgi:hypothetical protein